MQCVSDGDGNGEDAIKARGFIDSRRYPTGSGKSSLSRHFCAVTSLSLSLSLQSSAVEQVQDILMDILSWEIAEVVSPCLSRGYFVITYCDQSFPFPWHCLSAAHSLSGATLSSTLKGIPLSATWGRGWSP